MKSFEDARQKYEQVLKERNLPIPDVSIIQSIAEMVCFGSLFLKNVLHFLQNTELQHIADKANEFETATQVKLQQDQMCIERTKHEAVLAAEELRKITLVPEEKNVPKNFTSGRDDNFHSFA